MIVITARVVWNPEAQPASVLSNELICPHLIGEFQNHITYPSKHKTRAMRCVRILAFISMRVTTWKRQDGQITIVGLVPTLGYIISWTMWFGVLFLCVEFTSNLRGQIGHPWFMNCILVNRLQPAKNYAPNDQSEVSRSTELNVGGKSRWPDWYVELSTIV